MSKYETKPLKDERGSLYEEMRALADTAKAEKREMTKEENDKFDELNSKDTELQLKIQRYESLNEKADNDTRELDIIAEATQKSGEQVKEEQEKYRKAINNYWARGERRLSNEDRDILDKVMEQSRAQTVTTTGGGYLVPTDLANEIIVSLLAFGGMRSVARVISTDGGNPIDYPTNDDTGNTGSLLAINTGASETDLVFGTSQLNAYKYTSDKILVPNELLQDSAFDVAAFIKEQLTIRLARITNTHYTTGSGSSRPEGITIGSTQGKLSAASTATTFNELLDLKHSVDPAYRMNASWMFNDNTLSYLKKLSMSSANQSLWQPGIIGGEPATIDGQKYTINNDMASIAANARPILYGDMQKYIIRDVRGISILRSDEIYMESDQVVFVGFMRTDGKLMNSAAVKYMRMITT